MAGVYSTTEPGIIDETMLQAAVFSQGPQGTSGNYAKKEDILKIDNLRAFKCLVKLQLDNNIINKIAGLEHLVHLRWLDLSFNNIERIEGLDELVNIEDLSLYNNHITRIEKMDNLMKLQVLSIGNNKVDELEDIIYLRRFPKLESICLRGNPVCEHLEYKNVLRAFLPHIVYLDYKLTKEKSKFREMENQTDAVAVEFLVSEYTERLQQLWYELMKNEMILVEQLEEVIKEFELNITDMIQSFLEKVEVGMACGCFRRVAAHLSLQIFIDKETVTNALQTSNDAHLQQLDTLADNIQRQAKSWLGYLMAEIHEREEHIRNRNRVIEINRVIDAFRDALDQLDLPSSAEN
ncbi:Dynein regulatory complex subunit 3 [Fasciolopsis buskii]|uniref:Dynein regulatory complex subunit 3 n=1 Tax=Fasciolopsis buskii TaxID=27845 RepID=A0A8E0RUD7_9TREM|nr:Dynein regulatory complex subunit 3 [Fasciolopsis buski]